MPPSCALLGGFAMEVRVALLWQQRKREMLASTCFYVCILALCVVGNICSLFFVLITFCVSRRRRKMYYGHARLCVCLPVRAAVRPHYCTDPDLTWCVVEAAPSCALFGGFAIGARVALLWQHNANPSYKLATIP